MRKTNRTAAALLGAAVLLSIPAMPGVTHAAAVQSQTFTGVVLNGVNLRDAPSTSSHIIRLLKKGEKLTSITKSGDYFYKVTTESGSTGYASANPEYIQISAVSQPGGGQAGSGQTGTIIYGVNFRTQPTLSSRVIRMLDKGETVQILGTSGSYYQIKDSNGTAGYISASPKYVDVNEGSGGNPGGGNSGGGQTGNQQVGTIIYGVNFRTQPTLSSSIIRMLGKGETVQILGTSGSYYQVKDNNGTVGYISASSKYVDVDGDSGSGSDNSGGETLPPDKQQLIDKVFAVGRSYLGTPYEFGSDRSNNNTFDCSDFTRTVYREATGIILPADSRSQGAWVKSNSTPVYDISSLKPGDLMFFMDYKGSSDSDYEGINKDSERITHVGIYMGNNQIMQTYSVESGGVRIDTLTASWKRRFLFGGSVL